MAVEKIYFENIEHFPVFLDYDLENIRCRGISAKIDFFSYGKLNSILDSFDQDELDFVRREGLFVRKQGLFLENGFFIFDFEKVLKNLDKFSKKLREAGLTRIFVEKSKYFDMTLLADKLDWCEVNFLELHDAPHRKS